LRHEEAPIGYNEDMEKNEKNTIPIFSDSSSAIDPLVDWMKKHKIPITRKNYLELNDVPKNEWTAEDESNLPVYLQDWSRFISKPKSKKQLKTKPKKKLKTKKHH
jgi:hypothetical protein